MLDDQQLTERAFKAYFRGADPRNLPDQPSNASGVEEADGKTYVHLFNVNGTLAVYRVVEPKSADPRLRRVEPDKWPRAFCDDAPLNNVLTAQERIDEIDAEIDELEQEKADLERELEEEAEAEDDDEDEDDEDEED